MGVSRARTPAQLPLLLSPGGHISSLHLGRRRDFSFHLQSSRPWLGHRGQDVDMEFGQGVVTGSEQWPSRASPILDKDTCPPGSVPFPITVDSACSFSAELIKPCLELPDTENQGGWDHVLHGAQE